ncbi:MAG TPA: hypothetical protein VGH87_02690 [Polyangiaceae bacterium]
MKAPQSGMRGRDEAKVLGRSEADLLGKVARARFEEEIDAALKRRPANEAKLAGALRALAPLSPPLRATLAEALRVLLRRRTLDRELYVAAVRSLAECKDKAAASVLKQALSGGDAGGTAALSAAAACDDPELAPLLSKIAASRQSHLAFGAEVARVARGESNGSHLLSLAPMIKESHRISLCVELFVPLARGNPVPKAIAKPLYILGEAERHLGRWLVLGEVATKAGDTGALDEARFRAEDGPASSRAAWSLVAWALEQVHSGAPMVHQRDREPPAARPTVEIVARLSDRPSADRDMTFLFRLAAAKAASAKGMLEALVKSASPLTDETAMRAAMHLARDYGRDDLRKELLAIARGQRREDQRGFAAAMLWDVGERDEARDLADELVTSKCLANVVWASLLRAASLTVSNARSTHDQGALLCSEPHVRWIHLGWLE